MTYATQDQLVERFGERMLVELSDRGDVATGAIDAGMVARALADTDAAINAALAKRYRLPMATTPSLVVDLALTIAIYKLHRFDAPTKIADDYKQALATLRQLGTGEQQLDVEGVEPATSGAGGVVTSDRPRDLTPGNLTGFI